MVHIDRHLRIPGNEPTEIRSVKMLGRRYVRALSNAAQNPTFHNSTITQRLHAAGDGELLLIDEELEGLDVGTDLSVYFTTEHDSQKVLGVTRQESSKGVRFGQLLFAGVRNAFAQEYVAAKATSVEAAVSEAAAARFVNQRTAETGMQTYSPIGFLKTAPQRVQLLTRYVGNTLTFDNVLWNESGGLLRIKLPMLSRKVPFLSQRFMLDIGCRMATHNRRIWHGIMQAMVRGRLILKMQQGT